LAQSPFLVKDINTTVSSFTRSSNPSAFQAFGDSVYFKAYTDSTGYELFKYSSGTVSLVANIAPGSFDSSFGPLVDAGNGTFVFAANDSVHGFEVWKTDGTPAGTTLVKDINANGNGYIPGASTQYNNKIYFNGNEGVHGIEPWYSDGTDAGTQMLADLNPGSANSGINAMTVLGDRLILFSLGALWSSDGTAAGTSNIATVGTVTRVINAGGRLFFDSNTAQYGKELWTSDGTPAGTHIVADIRPGPAPSLPSSPRMVAVGSMVYFTTINGATTEIWKSDGSAVGTQFVKTLNLTGPLGSFVAAGSMFYFSIGSQLWRSDGTPDGTVVLDSVLLSYGPSGAFGKMFYCRGAGNDNNELVATDGTTITTVLTWPRTVFASQFVETGGKLYFSASDDLTGTEPWISEDGTAATTRRLVNVNPDDAPSSWPQKLTAAGDKVFFVANDGPSVKLWRSDGSEAGTNPLGSTSTSGLFTGWRNDLYFSTVDLWKSDGTAGGTSLLKSFFVGYSGAGVSRMFPASNYLYVGATDGSTPHLWRTDGTVAGTIILGNDLVFPERLTYPGAMAELAGDVYVTGGWPTTGMWRSSGTPATTKWLLNNEALDGYSPNPESAAGGGFFAGSDTAHGIELWRTDGRVAGESMVKDIAPGTASSSISRFTRAGGSLFFVADDGIHGAELWSSDGTEAGTILLSDIFPGGTGSNPSLLTAGSHLLYFVADDGLHGKELWQSDGTAAGTTLVADLSPGATTSNPQYLRFANGRLWFAADDGLTGVELWSIPEGGSPALVADLVPGSASSSPAEMVQAGGYLFFSATTNVGRELWALPLDQSEVSISDARVAEGTGGTAVAHFTVTRSNPATSSATVSYAAADGTAGGTDYVAASGVITFGPGETTKTIDVTVVSDSIPEPDETFVVTLSSPSNAILERASAVGVIEDDDHRVALSIVELPRDEMFSTSHLRYRITNGGPSTATELRFKYSESPGNMGLSLNSLYMSQNPATWSLPPLKAGASTDVVVDRSGDNAFADPNNPPGHTVTVSVSAAEPESDLSDNVIAQMRGLWNRLSMPPWLTTGTTATATYSLYSGVSYPFNQTLTSSSANVTVTPSTITIPGGQGSGTFSLNVGGATGRVLLSAPRTFDSSLPSSLSVPVVAPGDIPKLDSAMSIPFVSVDYGVPVNLTVQVAARKHDGTLPTGTITLRDAITGSMVEQKTLDNTATAAFTITDLPAGLWKYVADYSGDANFNALNGAPATVNVYGYSTSMTVPEMPFLICAGTSMSIPISMHAYSATAPTPGSISVTVGTTAYNVPLTPTGSQDAVATFTHAFAAGDTQVRFSYPATGRYQGDWEDRTIFVQNCAPMGLVADAVLNTAILNWTWLPGADHYEILMAPRRNEWSKIGGDLRSTGFVTPIGISMPAALMFTVRALDAAGNVIAYSNPDVALLANYIDDPVVPGMKMRGSHAGQVAEGIRALRILSSGNYEPVPTWPVDQVLTAMRIASYRNQIIDVRQSLGLPPFTFRTAPPAAGDIVRADDVQQLRDAMK